MFKNIVWQIVRKTIHFIKDHHLAIYFIKVYEKKFTHSHASLMKDSKVE